MRPEDVTPPISREAATPPSGFGLPASSPPGAQTAVPATVFPAVVQPQLTAPPGPSSPSAPTPPVEFLASLPDTLLPPAAAVRQVVNKPPAQVEPLKASIEVAPTKPPTQAAPLKPSVRPGSSRPPGPAAPIRPAASSDKTPRLVKTPSPAAASGVKKPTAEVNLAAVAPATATGPKLGAVKPSLWRRLTATPLNTMLLIAFPLALLSFTLAVIALVHQVGGTNTGPQVVALNSPTPKPTPSSSASPSVTPSTTPSSPDSSVSVPPPLVDLPTFEPVVPTFMPSELASQTPVPTPTAVPSVPLPSFTPNSQTNTPWTYTPRPTTPRPVQSITPSVPTAANPGPVPVMVVDYPPVAVTLTDTGKGDLRDRLVPVVSGTAAAGTDIRIGFAAAVGHTDVKVKADSKGRWTTGPLTAVGLDTTTIEINGTALNGDESWTFTTVNLAGPSVLISPKGNQTFSARVVDRPGTVFEILLNGEPLVKSQVIGLSGTWESMLPALKPGNHQVGVRIIANDRPGPVISTLVRVF